MKQLLQKYRYWWSRPGFARSVFFGLMLFVISLFVNYFAGMYATAHASSPIADFILNYLPTLDVKIIFIDGFIIFLSGIVVLMMLKPETVPFIFKGLSALIITRSFFVVLTHLGLTMPIITSPSSSLADKFTFGGDLFFSAHTAIPFLMALIFWEERRLRHLFLLASVIFGSAVLVGHLHYSIDVFAAFFITYTVFHITTLVFAADYRRLSPRPWSLRRLW